MQRDPYEDPEESAYDGLGLMGHVGPYFPYDLEDPRAPSKKKRKFQFGFAIPPPPKKTTRRKR